MKYATISFLFVFLFLFSSCAGDETKQTNETVAETDTSPKTVVDEKGNVSFQDGSIRASGKVKSNGNSKTKTENNLRPGDKQVNVHSNHRGNGTYEKKNGVMTITGTNFQKAAQSKDEVVNISGQGNSITLVGKVKSLEITGNENTVFLDNVKEIVLNGLNNKVYFKSQYDEQDPIVKHNGLNNTVELKTFN